jgi:chromodomain-helicase-DNA-binding protein 1
MSEADQKVRKIFEPISSTLVKVSGATKKKMPEDDARLKMIKMGLVTIGNHINTQIVDNGHASVEDKMWDYVSEHHWPQSKSKSSDKRVSGHKLRDMYKKISGKDSAATVARTSPTKPKPAPVETKPAPANGVASVKAEPDLHKPPADMSPKVEPTKSEVPVEEDHVMVDAIQPVAGNSEIKPEHPPQATEVKPSAAVEEKV